MHGLAVHGAVHPGHGADPMPAVVPAEGHDHGVGAMAETRAASISDVPEEGSPDHELSGFAELCLAILLAGIAVALFLNRISRLLRRDHPATGQGWPARSRRDRGPPCLFALSIQRC
jgi:hypothetical protein